ncbi:MAG TPA: hypothetical protein VMS76_07465 [Planctomycetota bacterium]|jgi:hypothetical protein|nr:hypothetical protein [Planctomycetota bacterium]
MSLLVVCAWALLGVWVVETVLLFLSYRTSAQAEGSRSVEPLL